MWTHTLPTPRGSRIHTRPERTQRPPPSRSRSAVRLDVPRAAAEDEPEPMPAFHHVGHRVRLANDPPRPRDLVRTALREDGIRSLGGPPRQLSLLATVGEVGLPRHRHLLGDVARDATLG